MKLKYEMTIVDIDGSTMAVPVSYDGEFRGVLHMNSVAADILEILKEDVTEDEIVARLLEIYEATDAEVRENLKSIIASLRENNLLVD